VTLRVDVEIERGAFTLAAAFAAPTPGVVALFGRSGAGKSSLIGALAGHVRPRRGRIALGPTVLYDSSAGIDLAPERRGVGLVFQDARLFPHLTVRQNLLYGWKRASPQARRDPAQIIELLAIGALLERRPHTLSGGEKSRVAIGRALLAGPRLLLLDEPLANLDTARKRELLRHIERLRDELALPIVYVSHAMDEVARLADTLVVLEEGRVRAAGDIAEVSADPALAAGFGAFEWGAVLRVTVAAHDPARGLTHLAFAEHTLTVPLASLALGERLRVRVLARDLILARRPPEDTSLHNCWAAEITAIAPQGQALALVSLKLGEAALLARITRDAVTRLGLAPGAAVYALVKSVALEAA
jgi:molybdate transport system ATP-binding protein